MRLFLHAHATHPDWRHALALAAVQIEAQRAQPMSVAEPTIGWVYLTDHYADNAAAVLAALQDRWPGVAWVGAVANGIAGNGVEYIDEPALGLMLGDVPRDQFKLCSGVSPMGDFLADTAQVHADPGDTDIADLIADFSALTRTGYLFGGLATAGSGGALHIADGVLRGGLSGVAFGSEVTLLSRVTQGCRPIAGSRNITEAERNVVYALDGEPALDCLLRDLGAGDSSPQAALPRLRSTLVGLSDEDHDAWSRPGQFGTETRVRHIVGIDPARRGVAIGDAAPIGARLAFCRRDSDAARRDLRRICAEIREELEPEAISLETALALQSSGAEQSPHPARRIAGAVYVSCVGRGGPHFGAPSGEMAVVRHALGDVPLVGFFAAGEVARAHVYGYTGVLTVFVAPSH